MVDSQRRGLALLYPGDRALRDRADPSEGRFAPLFSALSGAGIACEPAVYHDDFCAEVEAQLAGVRAVLVWHNPIEGGRTRRILDAMLCRIAERGIFVSAHPDTILRMGTKDVLVQVRDLPFGSDAHRVDSIAALEMDLPRRLATGPRVLKQRRGHSGIGVHRIEQLAPDVFALRHAQRGSVEERATFAEVVDRLRPYFADGGHMIDQAWQARLADGMVRAYLVGDRVAGFGWQAVNALHPATADDPAPQPGPRLYSGPDDVRFQGLRRRLEGSWVDMLVLRLGLERARLPVLWDADFFFGEPTAHGDANHVLCEINVSSVAPYPDSANAEIVCAVERILSR